MKNFAGTVLHSSQYDYGEAWKGKKAVVIGTGNSGHDIAQDLHSAGAKVTLVQRSSTMIVNVEPSAQLQYALYDEGIPLADCDLITTSMPLSLVRKSHIALTETARTMEASPHLLATSLGGWICVVNRRRFSDRRAWSPGRHTPPGLDGRPGWPGASCRTQNPDHHGVLSCRTQNPDHHGVSTPFPRRRSLQA